MSLFNWIRSKTNCKSLAQINSFPNWCSGVDNLLSVTGQKSITANNLYFMFVYLIAKCLWSTQWLTETLSQDVFEYFQQWKLEQLLCAKQRVLSIHLEIYIQNKNVCIISFWEWPFWRQLHKGHTQKISTIKKKKRLKSTFHSCHRDNLLQASLS